MNDDTIIAVSTPPGQGGLGVVRLSGPRALAVARKIFRAGGKPLPRAVPPRLALSGVLYDAGRKEALDEAVLTFFPSPRSYTREDVVEVSCHGSPVILDEALRLGVRQGARPAHPGEFTLRAYVRGRLDILQAQAVDDLIRASSLEQARISARQLGGSLSRRVGSWRKRLVELLADVEAGLEFPDEEAGLSRSGTALALEGAIGETRELIKSYETGRALREGMTLAVVGRMNVGKSTLFNALLGEDRAITTPYPGTTRDFLREKAAIKGAVFNVVDMAGLGRTSHPVEKAGVAKGRKIAETAEGLLVVLDASRKTTAEDLGLIEKYRKRKVLLVFNKIDLPRKADKRKILTRFRDIPWSEVSALRGTNLEGLKEKIYVIFAPTASVSKEVILHSWQKALLEEIAAALESGLGVLHAGYQDEVCAEEIRNAMPLIGRLTGEIRTDEVMERIFSRFCVGK